MEPATVRTVRFGTTVTRPGEPFSRTGGSVNDFGWPTSKFQPNGVNIRPAIKLASRSANGQIQLHLRFRAGVCQICHWLRRSGELGRGYHRDFRDSGTQQTRGRLKKQLPSLNIHA
jgi:hypothetical protein